MDANRNKQLSELRRQIVSFFTIEELKLVAFELGINWDDLSGDKISTKAQSLVVLADHTGKLDELIAIVSKERPNVTWEEVVVTDEPPSQVKVDNVRTAVWNGLHSTLWKQKTFLGSPKGKPPLIERFSYALWKNYFNKPVDSRSKEPTRIFEEIRKYFFSCRDDEFNSYLEFILNYWNDLNHYSPDHINRAVNGALKREGTGLQYKPTYEHRHFVSGAIVRDEE
ncbi:MAG: hypothetical protein KJ069_25985 [Anaerolineae bacterium]|nr:hypothetical protein [Anaerolineae bacterium]